MKSAQKPTWKENSDLILLFYFQMRKSLQKYDLLS